MGIYLILDLLPQHQAHWALSMLHRSLVEKSREKGKAFDITRRR